MEDPEPQDSNTVASTVVYASIAFGIVLGCVLLAYGVLNWWSMPTEPPADCQEVAASPHSLGRPAEQGYRLRRRPEEIQMGCHFYALECVSPWGVYWEIKQYRICADPDFSKW